ncbi:MAG: hypothetical protein PUF37_01020 [Prevotellaceae bacterium]|nr:hypothetical protein [Prevotellaceae bacterium]
MSVWSSGLKALKELAKPETMRSAAKAAKEVFKGAKESRGILREVAERAKNAKPIVEDTAKNIGKHGKEAGKAAGKAAEETVKSGKRVVGAAMGKGGKVRLVTEDVAERFYRSKLSVEKVKEFYGVGSGKAKQFLRIDPASGIYSDIFGKNPLRVSRQLQFRAFLGQYRQMMNAFFKEFFGVVPKTFRAAQEAAAPAAKKAAEDLAKGWKNIAGKDLKVGDKIRLLDKNGNFIKGTEVEIRGIKDGKLLVEDAAKGRFFEFRPTEKMNFQRFMKSAEKAAEEGTNSIAKTWKDVASKDLKVGDKIRLMDDSGNFIKGTELEIRGIKDGKLLVEDAAKKGKFAEIMPTEKMNFQRLEKAAEETAKDGKKAAEEMVGNGEYQIAKKFYDKMTPQQRKTFDYLNASLKRLGERQQRIIKAQEDLAKSGMKDGKRLRLNEMFENKLDKIEEEIAKKSSKMDDLMGQAQKGNLRKFAEHINAMGPKKLAGWAGVMYGAASLGYGALNPDKGALHPTMRILFGNNGLVGSGSEVLTGQNVSTKQMAQAVGQAAGQAESYVAGKLGQAGQTTEEAAKKAALYAAEKGELLKENIRNAWAASTSANGYSGNGMVDPGSGDYGDPTTQGYPSYGYQNGNPTMAGGANQFVTAAADKFTAGSKVDLFSSLMSAFMLFSPGGWLKKAAGFALGGVTASNVQQRKNAQAQEYARQQAAAQQSQQTYSQSGQLPQMQDSSHTQEVTYRAR